MNDVQIRPVKIEELGLLQEISKKTFYDSFKDQNSEEDMQRHLESHYAMPKLKAEWSNPESHFYFVTEKKQICGYLKINEGASQSENQGDKALEIERIYVLSMHQGKSLGKLMIDFAVKRAINLEKKFIWLGVWEANTKGIQFYMKNSFLPFDKHIFKVGSDLQTDILMKRELL
jgi:diamine N-acetyltransferase